MACSSRRTLTWASRDRGEAMVFRCGLDRSVFSPSSAGSDVVSDDLDNYEVTVMNACEILADTGLRFLFRGFGREDWKLDVRYDLSVFMEQLPEMLSAVTRAERYEFYFYSQGVEQNFVFSPIGEKVEIRCASGTSWVPDPELE